MTTRNRKAVFLALLGWIVFGTAVYAEKDFQVSVDCPKAFAPSKGEKAKITAQANNNWCGTITIRNAEGTLVRVLTTGFTPKKDEPFAAEWDGADFLGAAAPPGKYIARVEGNTYSPTRTCGGGVVSLYERHNHLDAKGESFFFQSGVVFNETPYTSDCGVPDRVLRRFDFDGNPLGEMIYIIGAESCMTMAFCVDIHDSIYINGYRNTMSDGMPATFCKYDGNTGKLIWEQKCSLAQATDPSIIAAINVLYENSKKKGEKVLWCDGMAKM